MITKQQIVAIKAAQRDAGLSDEAYRELLFRETGVSSCKDLNPGEVSKVLSAIRANMPHRRGWQMKQINLFKRYAKYCGMDHTEYRSFLYNVVQIPHEESPMLNHDHFENVMAELESDLEFRIQEGKVEKPKKVNLYYWRNRQPSTGHVNTRELHMIEETWNQLYQFLPAEKQNDGYLLGLARKACGRNFSDFNDIYSNDARKIIEALKNRIKREQKKLENEVPF